MTDNAVAPDGHGPDWAAAVADLADRAGRVFGDAGGQAPLSVVDLEPWRRLDAWWLRSHLEPLAALSGRPFRYVPCMQAGPLPRGYRVRTYAPAWSANTSPVELAWPARDHWKPDGPVLFLAGDLPRRLPQDLLLAHHGKIQEWGGAPTAQWQPLDAARHPQWLTEGLGAYAAALPSSMFSLPAGYWRFLEQAIAWARHGCLILTRAEGWSSLRDIREDAAQKVVVHADSPPVNFHWLAQHLPQLGASVQTVCARRGDAVQLAAAGLANGASVLPALCKPLSQAARPVRADRVGAIRALAQSGDMSGVLAMLQLSAHDPALVRGAWRELVPAAASLNPLAGVELGTWLERVMADNPWIGEDVELLRACGHVALACGRVDLAQAALAAVEQRRAASAADIVALGRCYELVGRFDLALQTCNLALARDPAHEEAASTRARVAERVAALGAPWRVQQGPDESPLMLDPLHADHAPMLVRQMRDPSIPAMTALPVLEPGDDGRAWIQGRLHDGPAAYAIVHRHLGFVGYLELRLWESTAFVCYWIGADYQGFGFCAPALALGCELAWRHGVDLLLSSAYDDNVRSLRVLFKRGFQRVNARGVEPDNERTFVMLSPNPMEAAQVRRRLIEFCDNTASGLRFIPLEGEAPSSTTTSEAGTDGSLETPGEFNES